MRNFTDQEKEVLQKIYNTFHLDENNAKYNHVIIAGSSSEVKDANLKEVDNFVAKAVVLSLVEVYIKGGHLHSTNFREEYEKYGRLIILTDDAANWLRDN